MMSTLTDAQRLEIVNEATSWIGTPWHHEARVKGVGVDCVMLLCEVYERVGLLPHVVPARYPQDIMLHKGQEVVLGYLDLYGAEVETPQLGDVVVYRFARSFSHAGIYAGEREIVHAYRPARMVLRTSVDDGGLAGRPRRYYAMHGG